MLMLPPSPLGAAVVIKPRPFKTTESLAFTITLPAMPAPRRGTMMPRCIHRPLYTYGRSRDINSTAIARTHCCGGDLRAAGDVQIESACVPGFDYDIAAITRSDQDKTVTKLLPLAALIPVGSPDAPLSPVRLMESAVRVIAPPAPEPMVVVETCPALRISIEPVLMEHCALLPLIESPSGRVVTA